MDRKLVTGRQLRENESHKETQKSGESRLEKLEGKQICHYYELFVFYSQPYVYCIVSFCLLLAYVTVNP